MTLRLSILMILLMASKLGFACACGGDGLNNEEAFSRYDHIFSAQIIEAKLATSESNYFQLNDKFVISSVQGYIKTKFQIKEIFKGQPEQVEEINGLTSGNSCGINIIVGEEYLIYAKGKSAFISICSRNKSLSNRAPIDYVNKVRKEISWLRDKSSEVRN